MKTQCLCDSDKGDNEQCRLHQGQTQIGFEERLKNLPERKLAMLAVAKLLLRGSEGDGEAGALAVELERRTNEK